MASLNRRSSGVLPCWPHIGLQLLGQQEGPHIAPLASLAHYQYLPPAWFQGFQAGCFLDGPGRAAEEGSTPGPWVLSLSLAASKPHNCSPVKGSRVCRFSAPWPSIRMAAGWDEGRRDVAILGPNNGDGHLGLTITALTAILAVYARGALACQ